MTYTPTDAMIRICHSCAITWKGSAPCWCCGANGTRGGEALAAHCTTAGAGRWEPPQTPMAGVKPPPAAVPTMRYDPQP